ncbi:MAG: alpha/beta fold hydrolase [Wenzhouxiangellaceae bacterium]
MAHDQPRIAVRARDGHEFELIEVGCTAPERTLLMLPGMGMAARHYIGFAQALNSDGCRVLIHEWRGNGASSWRASRRRDWGYPELLEFDLEASLQHARSRADGGKVWLAGHSLGAQLACLLAARRPADVAGLTLIAGGSPYWRTFPWPERFGLLALLHCAPLLARAFGHFPGRRLGFAGREAHGVMLDWARTGRHGHYGLVQPGFQAEPALAELALPLLAVQMARDRFVPEHSRDWLLTRLKSCQVTIVDQEEAPGEDHFSWLDRPAVTARAVAAWLNRQSG